jgi:hypothetical protein
LEPIRGLAVWLQKHSLTDRREEVQAWCLLQELSLEDLDARRADATAAISSAIRAGDATALEKAIAAAAECWIDTADAKASSRDWEVARGRAALQKALDGGLSDLKAALEAYGEVDELADEAAECRARVAAAHKDEERNAIMESLRNSAQAGSVEDYLRFAGEARAAGVKEDDIESVVSLLESALLPPGVNEMFVAEWTESLRRADAQKTALRAAEQAVRNAAKVTGKRGKELQKQRQQELKALEADPDGSRAAVWRLVTAPAEELARRASAAVAELESKVKASLRTIDSAIENGDPLGIIRAVAQAETLLEDPAAKTWQAELQQKITEAKRVQAEVERLTAEREAAAEEARKQREQEEAERAAELRRTRLAEARASRGKFSHGNDKNAPVAANSTFQRELDSQLEKQRRRAWKAQSSVEEDDRKTTTFVEKEKRAAAPKAAQPKRQANENRTVVKLRVHPEHGAGLELRATVAGYAIDAVEDEPGQPGVDPGDVITAIRGVSLSHLSEEDLEDRFGENFGAGVDLVIEKPVTEVVMFPENADCDWGQFEQDLKMFSDAQGVRAHIVEVPSWRVHIEGPQSILQTAIPELRNLFGFHFGHSE